MIRFCAYILLAALTLQSFYRSIIAVEYQIHLPEYLARCINKGQPELQCNGQCVLMKKIEEKEKEDTKKMLVVYEYSSFYVLSGHTFFTMHPPKAAINLSHFSPYLIDYAFNYHTPIFHPPIA